MNLNDLYPSNYLKAADLQDKQVNARIREVKVEELGRDKERKPVLYFHGSDKGLVLNKTNATMIGDHYGPRIPDWYGKSVTLYSTWVDFSGRSTQAIRIAVPAHQPQPTQPMEPAQVAQAVEMQAPPAHMTEPIGEPEFIPDETIPF